MRTLLIGILLFTVIACNTKYDYIDTGISNGVHDCSMLEYLQSDRYNWDSAVVMIRRAHLEPLFEGQEPGYEQITFFGPTNHSIRNWMLDSAYMAIDKIPEDSCRMLILRHVVKGRHRMIDIPNGSIATSQEEGRNGGVELVTPEGNTLWLYTVKSPWYGVEDAGPLTLNMISLDLQQGVPFACPDIQTNTGIVHSLDYNYEFGQI